MTSDLFKYHAIKSNHKTKLVTKKKRIKKNLKIHISDINCLFIVPLFLFSLFWSVCKIIVRSLYFLFVLVIFIFK